PSNFVIGIFRFLRDQLLENVVGVLVAAGFPQRFCLLQRLRRRHQCKQQPGHRGPQHLIVPDHFSIASCTLASSSRSCVSCFLYSSVGMAAFSYFSLSMACSSSSFLASSSRFAGSRAIAAFAPNRTTENAPASLPWPFS